MSRVAMIALVIVIAVAGFVAVSNRDGDQNGYFHSEEGPFKMKVAEGWQYNPEVSNFFAPPADGFINGTTRLRIGQVGLNCSSQEHLQQQAGEIAGYDAVVQDTTVSGIEATYIYQQDDPRANTARQFFGDADVLEIDILFMHDCHLWSISLATEVANMGESLPEFTAMLSSIRFEEGSSLSWLPFV